MEIEDLGGRLRHRRVTAGRTIASVAADAGLSVPYIANLENGRGNPTLSAVNRLAAALGARLMIDGEAEADDEADDDEAGGETTAPPDTLVPFSRSARFTTETTRLAHETRTPEALIRRRLLTAMTAIGALADRPLSDLDRHRILDTAILIMRG